MWPNGSPSDKHAGTTPPVHNATLFTCTEFIRRIIVIFITPNGSIKTQSTQQ